MSTPRILFLADQFSDVARTAGEGYPGGAELTDEAAIEACPWPVELARSADFKVRHLAEFDIHVLGNLQRGDHPLSVELCRLGRHVFFEHDLRICQWSGNFPSSSEAMHQRLNRCICPHPHLSGLYARALGSIFLTHRQLAIYKANPLFEARRPMVLGSSLMNRDFFRRVDSYREQPYEKDIEAAVVFSKNRIKGYEPALEHCQTIGISPHVIKDLSPGEVLDVLARSKRLVFLPQSPEPAGRLPLEARFLGCEVITNGLTGVCGESWWNLPDALALEVVRDAPLRFWRIVEHLRTSPSEAVAGAPTRLAKIAAPVVNAALAVAQPVMLVGPILALAARHNQREIRRAESVSIVEHVEPD
ncbi:MAG: hypothetical protein H0U74_23670 [Bradymonadaceae bacterium]|nr:hypothetical protein [Lujinxingiaceae bacterium]